MSNTDKTYYSQLRKFADLCAQAIVAAPNETAAELAKQYYGNLAERQKKLNRCADDREEFLEGISDIQEYEFRVRENVTKYLLQLNYQ